jgi:protein involved in sex pheromone biosynthesis
MRNLMILGAIAMGLTLVGCGDKEDDTAVEEEVEDTSVEEAEETEDSGDEAESEETE